MVDGRDGRPGQTGAVGADGAEGAAGRTGEQGGAGVDGVAGPDGVTGATGADGARGGVGRTGLAGPAGEVTVITKRKLGPFTAVAFLSLLMFLALLAWTSIVSNNNSTETRRISQKVDRQLTYLQTVAVNNHRLLQEVSDLTEKVDCRTQQTVQRIVDQLVPSHPNVIIPACQIVVNTN